jgi:hypothetical protein
LGVDLTLIPVMHVTSASWHPFTKLWLTRNYELFGRIEPNFGIDMLPEDYQPPRLQDLPPGVTVSHNTDTKWEERTDDQYGKPLKWCWAGELAAVPLPENTSPWNRAAWAYLAELPAETPVVLWWH